MILNINPCYRQFFYHNEKFYIEVRNECPDYLYIFLNYKIGTKKISKPSPPFGSGKIGRVVFPDNAARVSFRILDCYSDPPSIVCNGSIPNYTISIYKVEGPRYGQLKCTKISC